MFPRVTSRSSRTTIRTRAAVMAAGLGASVALGAGVAAATGTTAASSTTAAASAVEAQAAAQAKAAKAEKAAASAKKSTTAKKTATKKKAASWVDPVKKYELSASFAQNGGMWAHKHSGQDFAVPIGTNVVAAHGGTVVKAGGNGAGDGPAYGNAIVIKHGNGTYSQLSLIHI